MHRFTTPALCYSFRACVRVSTVAASATLRGNRWSSSLAGTPPGAPPPSQPLLTSLLDAASSVVDTTLLASAVTSLDLSGEAWQGSAVGHAQLIVGDFDSL